MDPEYLKSIAEFAHEINRAYCEAIGDHTQPKWADLPAHLQAGIMMGVEANMDSIMSPEQSHSVWMEEKRRTGWKYAPVKNVEAREHPCMVPWDLLPQDQRVKDYLFVAVMRLFT
jgi:hypothetical protein